MGTNPHLNLNILKEKQKHVTSNQLLFRYTNKNNASNYKLKKKTD